MPPSFPPPPRPKDSVAPSADATHLAGVPRAEIVGVSELLVRLVIASRALERVRHPQGTALSPHAIRATMHLFQRGEGTVGELAEGLGVSMGWASRIVDELERAGHALRERDAADRRVVRLRLSPAASHLAGSMFRERGQVVAEALAALRSDEREAVARFLLNLIDGLEALALAVAPPSEA